jgi:hypothetical protein
MKGKIKPRLKIKKNIKKTPSRVPNAPSRVLTASSSQSRAMDLPPVKDYTTKQIAMLNAVATIVDADVGMPNPQKTSLIREASDLASNVKVRNVIKKLARTPNAFNERDPLPVITVQKEVSGEDFFGGGEVVAKTLSKVKDLGQAMGLPVERKFSRDVANSGKAMLHKGDMQVTVALNIKLSAAGGWNLVGNGSVYKKLGRDAIQLFIDPQNPAVRLTQDKSGRVTCAYKINAGTSQRACIIVRVTELKDSDQDFARIARTHGKNHKDLWTDAKQKPTIKGTTYDGVIFPEIKNAVDNSSTEFLVGSGLGGMMVSNINVTGNFSISQRTPLDLQVLSVATIVSRGIGGFGGGGSQLNMYDFRKKKLMVDVTYHCAGDNGSVVLPLYLQCSRCI